MPGGGDIAAADIAVTAATPVGGKKKTKKRSRCVYLPRHACFSSKSWDETTGGLRFDRGVATEGGGGDGKVPTHLVVMVNGIVGSAGNWRYAAKQLVKNFPDDVIVFRSRCNSNTLTFSGVDRMGERLAKEISSVVKHCPGVTKISFVAHSLGGLIARYAIANLYENQPINTHEVKDFYRHSELEGESVHDSIKGTIAGLEPINFITLATPHLGSKWHKQIPLLCGFHALEKMASHTSSVLGRTGIHLCLNDVGKGKHPLLLQMVTNNGDLQFISALRSFRTRVAYSNARSDYIVGWKTSSIRHQNELPKIKEFKKDARYPHILYFETSKSTISHEEVLLTENMADNDMEEVMIKGLNTVSWERVDVSFRSIQRLMAHTTILVKTYWMNSHGSGVIHHMIDKYFTDNTCSTQHSEGAQEVSLSGHGLRSSYGDHLRPDR